MAFFQFSSASSYRFSSFSVAALLLSNAAKQNKDISITIVEKADIKRSGCLAAGVNALNAYITKGHTPDFYCVLKKDNNIEISNRFDATVLWMDDVPLSLNKEYFIKLGTKRIAAKIDRIYYKTEINSGEHLSAEAITKNEIAFCRLNLAEAIPVDTFRAHKTLGEFILIDRLSNMTSACGVVEEVNFDENAGTFFKDTDSLRTHIFDEFVFDTNVNTVDTIEAELGKLSVGDEIRLKGKSFNYPEDFNILNGKTVVKIRKGRFAGMSDLSDFNPDGVPTVNNFGFKINLKGSSLTQFGDAENPAEWLSFPEYRSVYLGK